MEAWWPAWSAAAAVIRSLFTWAQIEVDGSRENAQKACPGAVLCEAGLHSYRPSTSDSQLDNSRHMTAPDKQAQHAAVCKVCSCGDCRSGMHPFLLGSCPRTVQQRDLHNLNPRGGHQDTPPDSL